MVGNEWADQQAAKGAKLSLQQVAVHKTVTDIWAELGFEEMPDEYSDPDVSRGSGISDDEVIDDEGDDDDDDDDDTSAKHLMLSGYSATNRRPGGGLS